MDDFRSEAVRVAADDLILLSEPASPEERMARMAALAPAAAAVLTTTASFPDALASGVFQRDRMLLGASAAQVPPVTRTALVDAGVTDIIILGGTAAVSDEVVAQLPAGITVTRIAGQERIETAALLATAATTAPVRILLARARGTEGNPSSGFIDAVGAGAWSALTGWPVLLIDGDDVTAATRTAIDRLDPDEIVVIGGSAAISDSAAAAAAAGRPVLRIAGPERFSTAAQIAAASHPDGAGTVFLLDGTDNDVWQDGSAAAHPAVTQDGPILLADGSAIPQATRVALANLNPRTIHCAAAISTCDEARVLAGLRPVADVTISPPSGQRLPAGSLVTVEASGSAEVVLASSTEGCIETFGGQFRAVLAPSATLDCTATFTVSGPDVASGTVTATWPAVAFDVTRVVGSADHAATVVDNRWDYSDLIDARVDSLISAGNTTARVDPATGVLHNGDSSGSRVTVPLLWYGFPGAIPIAPDGLVQPIDGTRFDQVLMRIWAERPSIWSLEWHRCVESNEICFAAPLAQGSTEGALVPGWQTVTVDLPSHGSWDGPIHNLYLTTAGPVRIDDVRIVAGPSHAAITADAAPNVALTWDLDRDRTNNTDPASNRWGVLVDNQLHADVLPPGEYWVHAIPGGTYGPFTLASPPHTPAPSSQSARDYATTVRGNPWDFAPGAGGPFGTDDVAEVGGATEVTVSLDGVLRGRNAGNDPYVVMAQPGPFDGSIFHTVTIEFALDGPLDLSFEPGGGSHGRLLYAQGDGIWRDGRPIVAYANQTSYTFDMRRPGAVEAGWAGWTAAPITAVRFDPNEDPGDGRGWSVSSIRITGDI